MPTQDWDIPPNLQPDPKDYDFDLETALRAVVGVRTHVPADAFTATTLGTERTGNGVVIRTDGLVLTIGYLVTEAEQVWLITHDGRAVPGHALAFDQGSGFGLVQALGQLGLPALEFGDSDSLEIGAEAILAAGGGRRHAIETRVVGHQEFAGGNIQECKAVFGRTIKMYGGQKIIGTVVEQAVVPVRPDPRGTIRKTILACILGGVLGVMFALWQDYVRNPGANGRSEIDEFLQLRSELRRDIRHPIRALRRRASRSTDGRPPVPTGS